MKDEGGVKLCKVYKDVYTYIVKSKDGSNTFTEHGLMEYLNKSKVWLLVQENNEMGEIINDAIRKSTCLGMFMR